MTLTAVQVAEVARAGHRLYGVPSHDGRSITAIYLADQPRSKQDVPLVRFHIRGRLVSIHDLQGSRAREVDTLNISDPTVYWPITFDAARFYGPAVRAGGVLASWIVARSHPVRGYPS